MTAVAKAIAETELVNKEDSAEERTQMVALVKEIDLTSLAKVTAETEAVLKEASAQETHRWWGW